MKPSIFGWLFLSCDPIRPKVAQRSAPIYLFFAFRKNVNPFQWLKYTRENISTIHYKYLRPLSAELYEIYQVIKGVDHRADTLL